MVVSRQGAGDGGEPPVATAFRLKDGCEMNALATLHPRAGRNRLSAEGWL